MRAPFLCLPIEQQAGKGLVLGLSIGRVLLLEAQAAR